MRVLISLGLHNGTEEKVEGISNAIYRIVIFHLYIRLRILIMKMKKKSQKFLKPLERENQSYPA